ARGLDARRDRGAVRSRDRHPPLVGRRLPQRHGLRRRAPLGPHGDRTPGAIDARPALLDRPRPRRDRAGRRGAEPGPRPPLTLNRCGMVNQSVAAAPETPPETLQVGAMRDVVIFGMGQVAEVIWHYLTEEGGRNVVAFTVDAEYREA